MFQDMSKKLSESMGPMKELVEIQTRMLEKLTRLQMECAQNCVKATMKQTQDLPECHSTEKLIDLQRKFARVVEETLVKASQDNLAALQEARDKMEQVTQNTFDAFAPSVQKKK